MKRLKGPGRVHLIQLLVISALVIVTAVTLVPLQRAIDVRMEQIKAELVETIESQLGRPVSYTSISPSIFRYLDIRDLRIHGAQGEPEVLIDVGRVKAHYDILTLIFGHSGSALTELRFDNTTLTLDQARDGDVLAFLRSVASTSETPATSEARPPRIRLRGQNVTVTYREQDVLYQARNVSFVVRLGQSEIDLSLSGDFSHTGPTSQRIVAEQASIQGVVSDSGTHGRFLVELPTVVTPIARIRNQVFQVDLTKQLLEVRKVRDRSPIDVSLTYHREDRTVDISFVAEEIVPAEILTLEGALSVFNGWMLGETSGRGTLRYVPESRELRYDLDLNNRVRNPEVPEPITVSAVVKGDMQRAEVSALTVRSREGSASFRGTVDLRERAPRGRLVFDRFQYGEVLPITADFTVKPDKDQVSVFTPVLSYAGTNFYEVELITSVAPGATTFSLTAFMDNEHTGQFEVQGRVGQGESPTVNAYADFRSARLTTPLAILTNLVPSFAGELTSRIPDSVILDTRIRLSLGPDGLAVEAPFVSLYDSLRDDRYASFGLFATDTSIEVRDVVAGTSGYSLRGGFGASVDRHGRLDFVGEVFDRDRHYEISGLADRDRNIAFTGSYGLDGRVQFARGSDVVFSLRGNDIPLPFTDNEARVSIDMSGLFRSLDDWDVRVAGFSLVDFSVADRNIDLEFVGRLGAEGGSLDRVVIRDDVSTITGSGTVSYRAAGQGINSIQLVLAGEDSSERYELQAILDSGEITAALVFERTPLARTRVTGIRGALNGILTIDGPIRQPRFTVDFQVVDGAVNNNAFNANGRVRYHEGVVGFESIRGQYVTNTVSAGRGTIDLRSATLDLQATVRNSAHVRSGPRDLRLQSRIEGPQGESDLLSLLEGPFTGSLTVEGIDLFPERYGGWTFSLERTDEMVSLSGGPSNAISMVFRSSGQFRIELVDPLPIRLTANGTLRDGQVEANITQVNISVSDVPDLLDFRVVRISSARITGGLRVVGPLNDPDIYGTLTADDVRGEVEFISGTVGPTKAFLVFQEKQLSLTRFETAVGRGKAHVSGHFILNRWGLDEFALDIQTDDIGAPVAHTFGTLIVDGHGVGRMRISGAPGMVQITGDIEARATTLAINQRAAPPRIEPGQTFTTVDLTMRTGRRVEFLWPSPEFPVIRAFAQSNQRLRLQYSDDTATFRLRGDVGIQGGEIFYFDRSFYIREGRIAFDETEELFDPRLNARAELREVGSSGPVRIFLIADGSRLSEFSPRFESSPTMTETEIAALIGSGLITGTTDDMVNLSTAMLATTELVTPLGIMNRVETGIRDALGLDLFSVRTQFFQNLVIRAIDDTGADDPLDNTTPSLGKYFDNTTVFLGKYLGSSLFLELLFQMRARNPLESEVQSFGGVDVDSEIGLEFQTPFFVLQWRMLPQNPQNLFLTDTTFAFSWGFSY